VIARVAHELKLETLRHPARELVPYSDIVRQALEEKFERERKSDARK
jgi:hypothetical protein